MQFVSYHIKGKGRGKGIGFPTINLQIPQNFQLKDGVYGVLVQIEKAFFIGAMHYGPIPVFGETVKSLEIYLIDVLPENFPKIEDIKIRIEVKKYIREIRNFPDPNALSLQIEKDVNEIRKVISSH